MEAKELIESGKAVLGIELGSTRVKAVLVDGNGTPVAQGSRSWENRLENGLWTYSLEDVKSSLQDCYADLCADVSGRYGVKIKNLAAIGISAMMHGYLAFDAEGQLLVPFRTWRNTNTGAAAEKLSGLFDFNVPLRWSISHLYQCILDGEEHVSRISFLTTLAGYVHWILTGRKVLGIGDASGMIPVDSKTLDYDAGMVRAFDNLVAPCGYGWKLSDILPRVLVAGEQAGTLTSEGAAFLDRSGNLQAGAVFCPPEGDAGTGMVATNAVRERTGNVSAGTSSFSMIVLEKALSRPYSVIDMVTTPDGSPVAMVHCNNCTSDINAWVSLFREVASLTGGDTDLGNMYTKLFDKALEGRPDCGGVITYNYVSGEPVAGLMDGRPIVLRPKDGQFTLADFIRSQIYASVAVLKIGNDILFDSENVKVDRITGHGGLFKSSSAGQRFLAAALNSPISVMETAGEGGAWGIALLALYTAVKKDGQTLPEFLDESVFAGNSGVEVKPDPADVDGFGKYIASYRKYLSLEEAAIR